MNLKILQITSSFIVWSSFILLNNSFISLIYLYSYVVMKLFLSPKAQSFFIDSNKLSIFFEYSSNFFILLSFSSFSKNFLIFDSSLWTFSLSSSSVSFFFISSSFSAIFLANSFSSSCGAPWLNISAGFKFSICLKNFWVSSISSLSITFISFFIWRSSMRLSFFIFSSEFILSSFNSFFSLGLFFASELIFSSGCFILFVPSLFLFFSSIFSFFSSFFKSSSLISLLFSGILFSSFRLLSFARLFSSLSIFICSWALFWNNSLDLLEFLLSSLLLLKLTISSLFSNFLYWFVFDFSSSLFRFPSFILVLFSWLNSLSELFWFSKFLAVLFSSSFSLLFIKLSLKLSLFWILFLSSIFYY